jgi:energy-coupling factor transporter ATP-binding protein EcfA2
MDAAVQKAMNYINHTMVEKRRLASIPFEAFLVEMKSQPQRVIRNVFQLFHDMIKAYIGEGVDEYPDDPESIHFAFYNCSRLFIEGSDHPFFADRLFANRLVSMVEAFKRGAQQNKIYIFKGPPGCGKSTFLNNILTKFEEYTGTEEGRRYETVWRFDATLFGGMKEQESGPLMEKLSRFFGGADEPDAGNPLIDESAFISPDGTIEIPCPSHDNPLLMIPKKFRTAFLASLFSADDFKNKLFSETEYQWVFRDDPCTICSALYQALLNKFKSPDKVHEMLFGRPFLFNRRLGQGISVYNPGDRPLQQNILRNPMFQRWINNLLQDSNLVRYIYSPYAKTNNGIYALMDVKSNNTERLIELHNIISEGVHKVEDMEENVNSLLLAVMNPEDQKNIQSFQSFSDRIEYTNIAYVLDLNTEVEIYRSIFGRHIEEYFLPRVLHNFARVIISTRMNTKSEALLEWIGEPRKYGLYCDENLQLLKMEIYTGYIPNWLSEEDRKRLTAKRRRRIIAESETEGEHGISGRDAIKIFNEFFSTYAKSDKLIDMAVLYNFFSKSSKDLVKMIPKGLLDSLLRLYDYTILQEVKESLYYYNEKQIAKDIQNYLFAINFEIGATEICTYTDQKLEITEDFLEAIERQLLGASVDRNRRQEFREYTQKKYTSNTLTQEMNVEGRRIIETTVFRELHDRYVHNLKEKALDPFLENENFRRAIKDYGEKDFKTYSKKIKQDVRYLIRNLSKKFRYNEKGAKEVCIYVIDSDIARKFANP